MYIFDKKDESIDVYTMSAKLKAIRDYKESVLENNTSGSLIYTMVTNDEEGVKRFESASEIPFDRISFEASSPDHLKAWIWSHFIGQSGTRSMAELKALLSSELAASQDNISVTMDRIRLLNNYINGTFDDRPTVRVTNVPGNDNYYFLRTEDFDRSFSTSPLVISNLINLPKELYILQLLLQGKFDQVVDERVLSQLAFFDIDYYRSFSIEDIEALYNTGLVSGSYEDTIHNAEIGSSVLRRIKK